MKLLGSFFDKFNSFAIKETKKRVIICEILKKELNVDISIEQISFNNGIIKIKTSSIIKNQIYIKKEKLINLISKSMPTLKVKSID